MTHVPRVVLLALLVAGIIARSARAGETASPADAEDQARVAFRRAVELYEERNFSGAGVEFRRAYQLAKNFRILYDLARVAVEEHDYAAALNLFNRYLADGGNQIASDRSHEVRDEMANLNQRIAHLEISFDDPGATVLLDDVEMGKTPLRSALVVNVGRRHVEIRPRVGEPLRRWVDAPAGETMKVSFLASRPMDVSRSEAGGLPGLRSSRAIDKDQDRHRPLWLPWSATAACAVGAGVAGLVAYKTSRDLSDLRQTFPVTQKQLADKQRGLRIASGVADGLSVATVALAGLSLYWTLDNRRDSRGTPMAVAVAWPGALVLDGHF